MRFKILFLPGIFKIFLLVLEFSISMWKKLQDNKS